MLMNIINIAYTYTIIYTLEINEAADNNLKMVYIYIYIYIFQKKKKKMVYIYILIYTVHRDFCK